MKQIPGYRDQFDPWIQRLLRESNERLAKRRAREAMLSDRRVYHPDTTDEDD